MALFYQKELFVISCCTENDPLRPYIRKSQ